MAEYKRKDHYMAKFQFDDSGIDDFMNELNHFSFDVECPECNCSFEISVDDIGKSVTCPNCGVNIAIESE